MQTNLEVMLVHQVIQKENEQTEQQVEDQA